MIEMPLIMNCSLSKHGNRQRPFECLLKETFNLTGLRQNPRPGAGVTNERSRRYEGSFARGAEFGDLFFTFNL